MMTLTEGKSSDGRATKKFIKTSLPILMTGEVMGLIFKADLNRIVRLSKIGALFTAMRLSENRKLPIALPAFFGQLGLKCFSWQIGLYIFMRQATVNLKMNFLFSSPAVYISNIIHAFLLIFHAEKISPSYLKLWHTTMPEYKAKGVEKWLSHFDSKATSSEYYAKDQTKKSTVYSVLKNIRKSFVYQFPLIVAIYLIGIAKKINNNIRARQFKKVAWYAVDLSIKAARSSAVLAVAPYALCAFPAFYAHVFLPLIKKERVDEHKVKRNPFLHLFVASTIPTIGFLLEPMGRRRTMVAYINWRIIEALLRTSGLSDDQGMKESLTSAMLIGTAASFN